MPAKSIHKRDAILAAAAEVFRELGFERASMADICRRVGGSKATVYSHFPSKEALFIEVVEQAVLDAFAATHLTLRDATSSVHDALLAYGRDYLALLYSPDVAAVRRLVISEAGRSGLGRRSYELGVARDVAVLEGYLASAMAAGTLRRGQTGVAARQLKALLEAELIDQFIFQLQDQVPAAEIEAAAAHAIATFLRAYAP